MYSRTDLRTLAYECGEFRQAAVSPERWGGRGGGLVEQVTANEGIVQGELTPC
jgi:hypothetical protein